MRAPGWRAIGLSALIHGVVIAPVVVFARPPRPIEFETIKIDLVTMAPADVVEPEVAPPQVAPQPEPEPERVAPEPDATIQEAPEEPPEEDIEDRPETEKPPETPDPAPPTTSESSEQPDTAAVGGEGLNIHTEGREFPYPEYLNNVIIQVHRYFRWNETSHPRGVIYFEILANGSVRNIRMVRSSGNLRFDFAVQGAIETAGNRGAFGPLPEGFAAPMLPVQLEVEPPR